MTFLTLPPTPVGTQHTRCLACGASTDTTGDDRAAWETDHARQCCGFCRDEGEER